MAPLIQIVQQPAKAPKKGGSASDKSGSIGTPASTLLTGSDGIDIAKLQLAKNTLLGL